MKNNKFSFRKIYSYFLNLYHTRRFKFWAVIAGITLILLTIITIMVISFSNRTEEQNLQNFSKQAEILLPLIISRIPC